MMMILAFRTAARIKPFLAALVLGGTLAAQPALAQMSMVPAAAPLAGADRTGPWGSSSYDFSVKVSEAIFHAINEERRRAGLQALDPDGSLGRLAGSYAGDMISGDFFGHFAPDGRDLKTRLQQANMTGYAEVAENLWTAEGAINWQVSANARRAVADWMQSGEGHREAILDPNLRLAGVGTAIREERIAVAMLFGRR